MADSTLTEFLSAYGEELALLHELAERRDYLARNHITRGALIAEANLAIARQRLVVRQARQTLTEMMAAQVPAQEA